MGGKPAFSHFALTWFYKHASCTQKLFFLNRWFKEWPKKSRSSWKRQRNNSQRLQRQTWESDVPQGREKGLQGVGKVSCALESSIASSLCLCPHPYTFVSTPSTRGSTFLIPFTFLCLCISCSIYWNALFSLVHLKFFLLILGEYYFHRNFFLKSI